MSRAILKPRPESLYARLSPEQRDALMGWLVDDALIYKDAVARLQSEFSVSSSVAALTSFFRKHCTDWRAARALKQAQSATQLPDNHGKLKADALARREFIAAYEEMDVKTLEALKRLELEERRMALAETIEPQKLEVLRQRAEVAERMVGLQARRVKLLEENQRRAKEELTALVSRGGLTPETKAKLEQAIEIL